MMNFTYMPSIITSGVALAVFLAAGCVVFLSLPQLQNIKVVSVSHPCLIDGVANVTKKCLQQQHNAQQLNKSRYRAIAVGKNELDEYNANIQGAAVAAELVSLKSKMILQSAEQPLLEEQFDDNVQGAATAAELVSLKNKTVIQSTEQPLLKERFGDLDPRKYPFNKNLEKWWAYSLGDLVKIPQSQFSPTHKNNNNMVCKRYPGSIGCRYLRSPNYSVNNMTLLSNILDKVVARNGCDLPSPNKTVIHIRLGDVIDPEYVEPEKADCFHDLCTFWPNNKQYVFPKSYYKHVLESGILPSPNETSISVIGFLYHHNSGLSKSSIKASHDYRRNVAAFFSQAGYSVTNLGDREPDQDFVYLCHAKTFVPGGGGFGRLIEKIVHMKGGLSIHASLVPSF